MESKCAAFWHHTNVRSDNRVFPCCRFKTPVNTFYGDLENILHTDEYVKLREQSLANTPIKGCEKCYYEESMGRESLRQQFNQGYDTDTVSLEFLEIGFDNICNLTCDGCWGEFSSSWAKKENSNIIHVKSTTDIPSVPSTVRKVLFLGGEPLMTTRHKKFLTLVNNKDMVDVIYNTNGTFLLDDDTTNLLQQFKSVKFILSIDGYGTLNDLVRAGSNWADIIDFINQIKKLRFDLVIHTVIHLNNWHGLLELEKFVKDTNVTWTTNILTYPNPLDIINIQDKTKILDIISSINIPNKEYILNHIRSA
jgi:sulfatase maturation enzyme AslB (radical SAM superfamily)